MIFINSFYLGNGQYGLAQGALFYFDKRVNELTNDEFTALIASLIAPAKLNIKDNPKGNRERVERINKLMSGEYVPKSNGDVYYDK